jgi:glycosyltransferase involved in cell wall biosynthesis
MGRARPVTSRIGGPPEWLDDRDTGLMIEPGDAASPATALASAFDEDGGPASIGQAASGCLGRFSRQRRLDHLSRVYQQAAT